MTKISQYNCRRAAKPGCRSEEGKYCTQSTVTFTQLHTTSCIVATNFHSYCPFLKNVTPQGKVQKGQKDYNCSC